MQARADGCEECLRIGDSWGPLRRCLQCGHVGCRDSSKNRHARAHFHAAHHSVIRAFGTDEDWAWCYPHQDYLDPSALEQALESARSPDSR